MRFTVYLGYMTTMMMVPMQSTKLELDSQLTVLGEGHTEADIDTLVHSGVDADASVDADAEAEVGTTSQMQAMIDADAAVCTQASAEVESYWQDFKDAMKSWSDDVKEGWSKLKETARGINPTTVSKLVSNGLKGQTAWTSIAHDYSDHVATVEKPLNFREFFHQSTFFHGYGDWHTFEVMQKARGEEPERDGYIAMRKDSRNTAVLKKLEEVNKMVETLMREAKVGKAAKTYSDFKNSVSKSIRNLSCSFNDLFHSFSYCPKVSTTKLLPTRTIKQIIFEDSIDEQIFHAFSNSFL